MSSQPQNPFANLPASGQPTMSPPPAQFDGGGPARGSGKKSVVNRFTPMEFSGTGLQLFGIQFLNLLLISLTLGIWTPWARVRKRRFFYNNTRILDEGLDYLATGFDIFKGWAIVTLILGLFYALPLMGVPFLQEVLSLLLVFIYPWAINRSLRFNARSLAWRDVRFDFRGSYLGSVWYFFLLPVIGILTLGLLVPFASKAMRDYIGKNYSFGTAGFYCDASLGSYYGAGFKTVLLFLILGAPVVGLAFVMLSGVLAQIMAGGMTEAEFYGLAADPSLSTAMYVLPVILFFLFMITGSYYRALTRNIMVNALRLQGGVRFRSDVSGLVLGWIMVSNLILVVLTLGLLQPWTQVRQYRYLTENTEIRPIADMKGFIDKQLRAGGSVGDAVGEATSMEITF